MTKILILVNDRDTQTLLELALEKEGYIPIIAASDQDVLDQVQTGHYSLLIFKPKNFDEGWELYRALKSNPALYGTGLLLLLRYPMFTAENAQKISQLLKSGDEYINHPYDIDELLGCVRTVWDQYGHPLPKGG